MADALYVSFLPVTAAVVSASVTASQPQLSGYFTRTIFESTPRPPKRPRPVAHKVPEAAAAVRGSSSLAGGPARIYGRHGPERALFFLRAAPRNGCGFSWRWIKKTLRLEDRGGAQAGAQAFS